jgi:hypothetical protein
MLDVRTLALGLAVFCATFAAGWWLNVGNLVSGVRSSFAKATVEPVSSPSQAPASQAPASQASASQASASQASAPVRPTQVAAKPPLGNGLTDDDRIRRPVIILAKAYHKPTCGADVRALYIRAATSYAEVLMRAAGCHAFPKCGLSMAGLDQVWQGARSALDREVADAMASVHRAGGLSDKSFRGDVGRAVRVIAAADFHSGPAPDCVESSGRSRRFRVRFRR